MIAVVPMNGSPPPAADSEMPATRRPAPPGRLRRLREALHGLGGRRRSSQIRLARILDLFEEHVYAGEMTECTIFMPAQRAIVGREAVYLTKPL